MGLILSLEGNAQNDDRGRFKFVWKYCLICRLCVLFSSVCLGN